MTYDGEAVMLTLARDWKAGLLSPVHPSVGRMLNSALVRHDEDAVPFARATDSAAPSITQLIRREHERAPDGKNGPPAYRKSRNLSPSVRRGANVRVR